MANGDDPIDVARLEKCSEPQGQSELYRSVRATLRWKTVPVGTRRQKLLAALLVFTFFLILLFHAKPHSYSEALLDTTLNTTLGFEKIFVINLKKASTRRDRLSLAASLTGIDIEYLTAVQTDEIDRNQIPKFVKDEVELKQMNDKVFASYRSHLNAIRAIVEQDLGSALILEDDTDWDVRIKQQMREWAQTSRQLVQPLRNDPNEYLDPTYFKANRTKYNERMPADLQYTEWPYDSPPGTILEPSDCAYGDLDRWDVLWLGHCGQEFANNKDRNAKCYKTPLARIVRSNDETVAEMPWFRNSWSGNEYSRTYPDHTRVTHWSCGQVCNTAYAISNRGAKKILNDLGVKAFKGMTDKMLRDTCQGIPPYNLSTCVSVSPPLFNQIGVRPDLSWHSTDNIRMSTSGNLDELITGERPFKDSFPDAETQGRAEGNPQESKNGKDRRDHTK